MVRGVRARPFVEAATSLGLHPFRCPYGILSREYTDRQGQQRTSLDVNAQSVDLLVPPKNAQPADDTFQNSPF